MHIAMLTSPSRMLTLVPPRAFILDETGRSKNVKTLLPLPTYCPHAISVHKRHIKTNMLRTFFTYLSKLSHKGTIFLADMQVFTRIFVKFQQKFLFLSNTLIKSLYKWKIICTFVR